MSFLGPQKLERLRWLSSCVSMSVGFGNVWRFPGVAYDNGGGAFVYAYILIVLLITRSLFFFEMCLGQFTGQNNVGIWNIAPIFKGAFLGLIFLIASSFRGLIHFVFLFFFFLVFVFVFVLFLFVLVLALLPKFQNPRTSLLVRTIYATKEVHAWQYFALASFFTYYCNQIYICN